MNKLMSKDGVELKVGDFLIRTREEIANCHYN